jgi:uncharacterized membrane protein
MTHSVLLPIHVAAGGIALVLGAVALSVKKGGTLHRRSGIFFVGAMLVMGISAAFLGNVGGGAMAVYFVATALTTVRPVSAWTRTVNVAALIGVIAIVIFDILGGVRALNSPGGVLDGVPFGMFFFLAAIMTMAAVGDVRVMRFGVPRGRKRFARHLWRMCFALFIAAGSFFTVEERVAKVLPEPLTTLPLRMLPILLVFVAMFYWLWRMRVRRTLPVLVRNDANP